MGDAFVSGGASVNGGSNFGYDEDEDESRGMGEHRDSLDNLAVTTSDRQRLSR